MNASERCENCGAPVGHPGLDRVCAACLLGWGTQAGTSDAQAGSECQPGPKPGEVFGNYEILELVGAGGMGLVYKARQRDLDRIVALKLIRAGALASVPEIRRFRREATTAGRLQHPHIVQVHEVGEHDGRHFFSMEFVQGRSLGELLREHPLPADRAARYLESIARAVHAAHQQGVIHRDLKPDNILIDDQDRPRLTDFGVARPVASDPSCTLPGAVLGTPSYMAPEQARGDGDRVSPASDVYSLGAVLYEALTGRAPFRADSVLETLRQVSEEDAASPRALNPSVPRDLETVCLKCLAKDPESRYPSAEALADDLRRHLDRKPLLARPVGRMERSWRWAQRNPPAAVSGALALTLLVLLAVTGLRGHFLAVDELREDAKREATAFDRLLRDYARHIETLGRSPLLRDGIATRDLASITNVLEETLRSVGTDRFENLVLMDREGFTLARVPAPTNSGILDRHQRDYFEGAVNRSDPDEIYFSRAYQSLEDNLYKFGISLPLLDEARRILGVLTGMVNTQSSTNSLPLNSQSRRCAVIARGDTNRVVLGGKTNVAPTYLLFLHHAFAPKNRGVPIEHPILRRLFDAPGNPPGEVDIFYRDPMRRVDPRFGGFWLAAMERIPGTPFVVVTQRRNPLPEVAFLMAAPIALIAAGCLVIRSRRRRGRFPDAEASPNSGVPRSPEDRAA